MKHFVEKCVPCTVSDDVRPGKQARLEVVHPQRRFAQVALDVQTITARTSEGYAKIVVLMDVLTRFVRVVPVTDEKAKTVAKVLIDGWITIFGPMERSLSNRRPSLNGEVVSNLTEMFGIKQSKVYPLHS